MILSGKEIPKDFTAGELTDVLAEQGAQLLVAISDLQQNCTTGTGPEQVSYAPPSGKEDERIIWKQDAEGI